MPRVVFGLPMYRSAPVVAEAIESLLAQDFADFALVAVDDASPDETFALATECARGDPRVLVEANPERLGMIGNFNRVLERAFELHPGAEYFAWASDNDLRDPEWLSLLVNALDWRPSAVLSYTGFGYLGEDRRPLGAEGARSFRGTKYLADAQERFRAVVDGVPAGALIHGLQRRAAREQAGPVPRVLLSDVLMLAQLSLYGEFVKISGMRWYRGPGGTGGSRRRQRAALFSRAPLTTLAPVAVQHTAWLFRTMVIGDRRPPEIGRRAAAHLCLMYLWNWMRHPARRRWQTTSRSAGRSWRGLAKRSRWERRKRGGWARRELELRLARTGLARYFVRLDRKFEDEKARGAHATADDRLAEALAELSRRLAATQNQAKVVAKLIRSNGEADLPEKLRERAALLASMLDATAANGGAEPEARTRRVR